MDKEFQEVFDEFTDLVEKHSKFEEVTLTSLVKNKRITFSLRGKQAEKWNRFYMKAIGEYIANHLDEMDDSEYIWNQTVEEVE